MIGTSCGIKDGGHNITTVMFQVFTAILKGTQLSTAWLSPTLLTVHKAPTINKSPDLVSFHINCNEMQYSANSVMPAQIQHVCSHKNNSI